MKLLGALFLTLVLFGSSFATPFIVSNKSSQTIDGVYAVQSTRTEWGNNIATDYIYAGYYDTFETYFYNTNYSFKITTTARNQCTVAGYVGTQPLVIWVYDDACYLRLR